MTRHIATEITPEEIEQVTAPHVVKYGNEEFELRNPNSIDLDQMLKIDKIAEVNILEALEIVAVNKKSKDWLQKLPFPFLRRVFDDWYKALELEPGESDGSGTSSQDTGAAA